MYSRTLLYDVVGCLVAIALAGCTASTSPVSLSSTLEPAAPALIPLVDGADVGADVTTPERGVLAKPVDVGAESTVPAVPTSPVLPTPTTVTGVAFHSHPGASEIAVSIDGELPQTRVKQLVKPLRLVMDVTNARLNPNQDSLMAVHDPAGVVSQVQALQSVVGPDEPEAVHIVAHLQAQVPFEVRQDGQRVRVILSQPVMQTAAAPVATTPNLGSSVATPSTPGLPPVVTSTAMPPLIGQVTPVTASPSATPVVPGTINAEERKQYTGEKISLDFQNADINDILRLIAEVSQLNIIAGPEVKGTVTTRMVDVPWDQALDVVLRINGLDHERSDNIVRVAPIGTFITERQERLKAQEAEVLSEPTVTQIVPVSYADVNELKSNLERVLSDRGSIWVDSRTHTLVVTDVQENVDDALALVDTLDRQTPQVMIESRIVEASRQFLRDLGVQLGVNYSKVTSRNFPSTIGIGGGIDSADGTGAGNFLVDLPAAVGTGQGGAISFALAGASSLLNIRLSALENSGQGKVVTNPKITTLDNTEAVIESGRRIPFATTSNEGTKTEFVDASIKLRVTPHVAPDGFIDLKVHATKNEADFSQTSGEGVPTILTREATTQMLVRDGDTVVIGGLYQRTQQSGSSGVPWLSRIPVIGWLFKTENKVDNHDELIIFITPRIIKQSKPSNQAQASLYN